jgi:hypothetical protein
MGRPLNKKYFANTNYELFGTANVGGESVVSVAVGGTMADYVDGDTITFSAPQITGGVTATGTITVVAGEITAVTITNGGSGYTSNPTITVTTDAGTGATFTVTRTTTKVNGIKCEAQVGAGSEVLTGDVIKQSSSKRYKVQTSDGTAVCKLVVTNALGANEMSIMATDSDGGTYLVSKLTARKAVLVPLADTHGGTSTAGSQFASGTTAKWTFGSAVSGTTVTIANQ